MEETPGRCGVRLLLAKYGLHGDDARTRSGEDHFGVDTVYSAVGRSRLRDERRLYMPNKADRESQGHISSYLESRRVDSVYVPLDQGSTL